jgi:hypothetical protein
MADSYIKMNDGFENKDSYGNINDAFTINLIHYSEESKKHAATNFQQILSFHSQQDIAGFKYADFLPIIYDSKNDDEALAKESYEEIATCYVRNFIANQTVILWSALGYLGKTRTSALLESTGINMGDIDSYKIPYEQVYSIIESDSVQPQMDKVDYQKFRQDLGLPKGPLNYF